METRVAVIGIIVDDAERAGDLNEILHDYGSYVLGRMGIPYSKRNINIISVAVEAPQDVINTMAGKIGRIPGMTAKTVYSSHSYSED